MPKLQWDHEPTDEEVRAALSDLPAWPGSDKKLVDYLPYIVIMKGWGERKDWYFPHVTGGARFVMWGDAHLDGEPPTEEITSHEVEGRYIVVHLTIRSPKFGVRCDIGTGDLQYTGKGPEATDPWELAYTRARRRTIGAFGFGILPGESLATVEDIVESQGRQPANQPNTRPAPQPQATTQPSPAPAQPQQAAEPAASPQAASPVVTARVQAVEKRMKDAGLVDDESRRMAFEAFAKEHKVAVDAWKEDAKLFQLLLQSLQGSK